MPDQTDDAEKSQLDKFKEAAQALECDEDEDAFKAKLREIVKPIPADKAK